MATLKLTPDVQPAYSASVMDGGLTRSLGVIEGREMLELSDETGREGGEWVTRYVFDGQRVEVEGSNVSTELFVHFCIREQRAPDAEALATCEKQVTRQMEETEAGIRASIARHEEVRQLAKQFLAKLATDRPDLAGEVATVATQVSACNCRVAVGQACWRVGAR